FFFFFFQAEDGIRDFHVTGVQTCALPISKRPPPHCRITTQSPIQTSRIGSLRARRRLSKASTPTQSVRLAKARTGPTVNSVQFRSEERRVGKECRSRGARER